jgi:hypothetical protein
MDRSDLQRGAARLRRWCTALCLFLLAVIVFEIAARAGAFVDAGLAGTGSYGEAAGFHRLGLDLLFAVPALLQLAAVWSVRQSLSGVAAGALFTPVLSRLLHQVGLLLLLAALCTLVLAPWLHSLAAERFPRLIEFDVANLVMAALGLTLMFLSKLLARAVDLQRELDDIF